MRGESDVAEFEGAVGAAPTDTELERTILSVPGVAAATVHRRTDGRSRLRLRLHPGEDAEPVSWAIAATLRERFAIALDPKAIRQVVADTATDATGDGIAADEVTNATGDGTAATGDGTDAAGDGIDAAGDTADAADATADAPDATDRSMDAAHDTADVPDDAVDAADASGAPDDAVDAAANAAAATDASNAANADHSPIDTSAAASLAEPRSEDPLRLLDPEDNASGARLAPRAAIHHLDVQRGEAGVCVTATLGHAGRRADGSASAVATSIGLRRAVAEATVSAMRALLGGSLLIGVDHVTVRSGDDPALVTAVLTWLTDRGEETLVGTSLLRADPEQAVMRATLDALNRRVEPLLVADAHLPR